MFGSRSVTVHVLRGALGFASLALLLTAPISWWWAVLLVPTALVAFGGCPTCWTVGLVTTITRRSARPVAPADAERASALQARSELLGTGG